MPQGSKRFSLFVTTCLLLMALVACGGPTPTDTPAGMSLPTEVPSAAQVSHTPEATNTEPPTEMASATPPPEFTAASPSSTVATNTATARPTEPPAPTEPPEPTDTPPPTQVATSSPAPTEGPPAPQVLSFTVSPTITLNVGDGVAMSWEARGERAELCPLGAYGPTACQGVPLVDDTTFVTEEGSLYYHGFVLRVWSGETSAMKTIYVGFQCQNLRQWFFEDPPRVCPQDEARYSYAAGQYFERGFMIWVEESDTFYVFETKEDENGWQRYYSMAEITLKPGADENNRVGQDPPPGLHEPVSGFGLVWRGEVEWPNLPKVRERLGWAIAPEFGYDTVYQCSLSKHPKLWNCYLRGLGDEILRLYPASSVGWPLLWEER